MSAAEQVTALEACMKNLEEDNPEKEMFENEIERILKKCSEEELFFDSLE